MSNSQIMKSVFVSFVMAMVVVQAIAQKSTTVTPVTGESWLAHLHRGLDETSMGKTGLLGPPSPQPVYAIGARGSVGVGLADLGAKEQTSVQGADLYRLNCRGCHGEFGLGAPPEINSVISATRGTYAQFTIERMNKMGMQATRAQANEMAQQAKNALLDRLHKGGVDMPPFPQLSDSEARAIFAYLRQLAEIPGAEHQQVHIEEPSVRIGEHIVKSTCHVCHTAAGVNPSSNELMQGAIPPLSSLTARVSLPEFERKVRHGAPIMMGTPLLPYRGRMPVFEYLTETEVADAYMYLKLYPPTAWTDSDEPSNRVQLASDITRLAPNEEPPTSAPPAAIPTRHQASSSKGFSLSILAEVIVGLLIVGGAIFTVYEVKRAKPRRIRFLDLDRLQSGTRGMGTKRIPSDPDKQAAWRSRLHRTEHDLFESSWFSGELESEDGAA